MIKNTKELQKSENDFIVREGILPYDRAINIFESLWNEAIKLGVVPFKDPMEGIDTDIKIAAILNSCSRKPSPG